MKKYLLVLLSCCLVSACATKPPGNHVSRVQGRSLVVTYDDSGSLSAHTGNKLLHNGVFSGVTAGIDGGDIAIKNRIPNPAIGTSEKLMVLLAQKYNLVVKTPTPYPSLRYYEYPAAVEKAGGADLVLNVVTKYWASTPFTMDLDNYNITIVTWASLRDAKTGNELVSGFCTYNPKYDDTNDAPTWNHLYKNGALGMKTEVTKSEDFCAQHLTDKVFNL